MFVRHRVQMLIQLRQQSNTIFPDQPGRLVPVLVKGELFFVKRRPAALEVARNSFHRAGVSKVEQIESELRKLSQAELRQIREWLDDFIEDELEFTPEFENSIQRSERDMAAGKAARVRRREHN